MFEINEYLKSIGFYRLNIGSVTSVLFIGTNNKRGGLYYIKWDDWYTQFGCSVGLNFPTYDLETGIFKVLSARDSTRPWALPV